MPPYKPWIRRPQSGPHDAAAWQRAIGWAVGAAAAFVQNSSDAAVLDAIGRHAIEQLVSEV